MKKTTVFKNGKLNPLITRPSQLIQICAELTNYKQKQLVKKYNMDQIASYETDDQKGTLNFTLKDGTVHVFDVVPVGILNTNINQWVWCWNEADSGPVFYARACTLKGLQNCISSPDFSEAKIDCDLQKAQAISCIATEYLGGLGRFVAPDEQFRIHFVLMKHHN